MNVKPLRIYPSARVAAKIKQYVSIAIHIQTCSEKLERKTIALAKTTSLQSFYKNMNKVGKTGRVFEAHLYQFAIFLLTHTASACY